MRDTTGNLPVLPAVFLDAPAPVVRTATDGTRELAMMRWGLPSPAFALKGHKTDPGVTNVRNVTSPHWRRWLGVEHRCLLPFTSFSEYETDADGKTVPVWFTAGEDRPLLFFAGIRTNWTSTRKVKEGEASADLFVFLTTEANGVVGPIHPKAMPVILTSEDEIEAWMSAPPQEALRLQRPLPDDVLRIVARGRAVGRHRRLGAGSNGA
jgi:putative SOS response-associated peptidase YedK